MKKLLFVLAVCVLFAACKQAQDTSNQEPVKEESTVEVLADSIQAISLLGTALVSPEPSEALMEKFKMHEANYLANPDDVDLLIWYGRFMAYTGEYRKAIDIYTNGIEKFPDDPRVYRHRGHRYISTRKFDEAINDFETAAKLIEGMPIQIEPDGMPNDKNIPVSSLQSNIYYHLGLSYYLKNKLYKAAKAFENCIALETNDDNLVSASHWKYMIHSRAGEVSKAKSVLERISKDMDIIENFGYHKICLFYNMDMSEYDLLEFANSEGGSSKEAIMYALANWDLYHAKAADAQRKLEEIVQGENWNAFGYIAAEADLTRF